MRRRLTARLSALFLTTVFLGSGFALPDLDALLYHSSGVAQPDVGHVDLPGGCGAHAEQCALTLATPITQLAPAIPAVRSISIPPARSVILPVEAPPATQPRLLHPPRAPPVAAS
jgi:hypothetical protein